MNLIYLYDEFMRVPDHTEGQAVYIIDPEIQEGYQISDKVLMYRYQVAEQAGAEIYQGKTLDILAEIHQKTPKKTDQGHLTRMLSFLLPSRLYFLLQVLLSS